MGDILLGLGHGDVDLRPEPLAEYYFLLDGFGSVADGLCS
jgi:hypothetical protein